MVEEDEARRKERADGSVASMLMTKMGYNAHFSTCCDGRLLPPLPILPASGRPPLCRRTEV